MRPLSRLAFALLVVPILCATSALTWAEGGALFVRVVDVQGRPIRGMQIGIEGNGGSAISSDDGKARILLAKQTKAGTWISLQILKSPPGRDFMIVSPWDYRTLVPSFENESENFIEVVVAQRGDRAALESGPALRALAEKINKANAPKTVDKHSPLEDPKANLAAVAKQYGLAPDDLDQAIRAWGARSADPYEAGIAALYEKRYADAASELELSLKAREEDLKKTQSAVYQSALSLGKTRYAEGDYRGASDAFRRAAKLMPDEPELLEAWAQNSVAMGNYSHAESLLLQALAVLKKNSGDKRLTASVTDDLAGIRYRRGDSTAAEGLYREALATRTELATRESSGSNLLAIASSWNNLGLLLISKGDYREGEELLREALDMREKALGPDHPDVAASLNNLARAFQSRGSYALAESFLLRALHISEKNLGPDHPTVASTLGNLAHVLEEKGNYAAAEPLFRRALAIQEKAFGTDHPDIATSLNNLGSLLDLEGNFSDAELLLRRGLAIGERAFGPDSPDVALILNNLAIVLNDKGDYAGAEPLFRQVLAIQEKAFGPDSPDVATVLNNLAIVLNAKREYAAAEPLFRRALAMQEKTFGPEHPHLADSLNGLADLYEARDDYAAAESLFRRALVIREQTLGPDHPDVAQSLAKLGKLLCSTKRCPEAQPLFGRALRIIEGSFGADSVRARELKKQIESAKG